MEIREYLLTKKEDIKSIEVKERLKDINENKNFIISIIGPRRAGKTHFLFYFFKNQ